MNLFRSFIFFILIALFAAPAFANAAMESDKWLMVYYPSWHRNTVSPSQLPWDQMTHIAAGPVVPKTDGSLDLRFGSDDAAGAKWMRAVSSRAKREDVVPVLFVGGASGVDKWQAAAAPQNRERFAQNLVDAAHDLGYEGIDLDWEPLRQNDYLTVAALAADIKKLDPDLVLTMPVGYINAGQSASPYFRSIARVLDQFNVMTYDMAGNWPGWQAWHHSALGGAAPTTPSSIETTVAAYLKAGVPKEKLGIGIPQYGYCWSGPKKPGDTIGTDRPRTLSYRDLMDDYFTRRARKWDAKAESPYLTFRRGAGVGKCTFMSYVDPEAAQRRAAFIVENDLGGAIVWAAGQAYFPRKRDEHPIISAVAQELF